MGQPNLSPHLDLARTFYREAYSIACATRGQIIANQMIVPLVLKSSNDFQHIANSVRRDETQHFDLISTGRIVRALVAQQSGRQGIIIPIKNPIARLRLAADFCEDQDLISALNLSIVKKSDDWPIRVAPQLIKKIRSHISTLENR